MTVKDLIKELLEYPLDSKVCIGTNTYVQTSENTFSIDDVEDCGLYGIVLTSNHDLGGDMIWTDNPDM